jgi:hypothetical protein
MFRSQEEMQDPFPKILIQKWIIRDKYSLEKIKKYSESEMNYPGKIFFWKDTKQNVLSRQLLQDPFTADFKFRSKILGIKLLWKNF